MPLRGPRDDRTSTSSNRDDRTSTSSNRDDRTSTSSNRDDRTSTSSNRDDRTSTSSNRGNFWVVLEMMAKCDDTLRKHLETGRKNAQYTSIIIMNEVIDVVVEYIRKEHTRSLDDENAFFSIMANEVTDPHGNQIMSVCLRMLAHCKVKQFFFYLIHIERVTGEAIAHGVIECLKVRNIDISKARVRATMVRSVCPRIKLACRRG